MARRNRNTESDTNPAEEATVSTSTEETVVEATEPTDTETAPAVEATEGETPESTEPEIDLTEFKAAVESAIEGHDNATGTVPEALVEPVTQAYRNLTGVKAKNAAKKVVEEAMREGMASMNIGLARAYMVLSDNLTAGTAARAERQPADPTEALVQRVAGLELARTLVEVPEGVSADWQDKVAELLAGAKSQVEEYTAFLADTTEDKTEPEGIPSWIKASVKLAQGKAAKVGGAAARTGGVSSFTGERRDIGEHIRQAFADKPSGAFLTIAEIRQAHSTEYPNKDASAGAISARLFPKTGKCTLDFIVPDTNESGRKGARKV